MPQADKPPAAEPTPGWSQSLFTGACGIALLHIERARAGTGPWTTARDWAATITRRPVTAHPDTSGLHHGAPAVAYALHAANQPAYATALTRLDQNIETLTRARLHRAHHRVNTRQLPRLSEYDLIRGLTGIGAYLLHRHRGGQLLRDVLAYLTRLTQPLQFDGHTLPGWWTANSPTDTPSPHWPGGHANLGLAHGITGPLALLALTHRAGITIPGQLHAIGRICHYLDQWQRTANARTWWPETISATEHRTDTSRQLRPGRPSWCYGTPGIVRAQQLAALATKDHLRRRRAEQALATCLADPFQLAQLTDRTLCHGWTGLHHTATRVIAEAEDPERFTHPTTIRRPPHQGSGLLEGRTGQLLAHHTATNPTATWDTCLLLTGPTAERTT